MSTVPFNFQGAFDVIKDALSHKKPGTPIRPVDLQKWLVPKGYICSETTRSRLLVKLIEGGVLVRLTSRSYATPGEAPKKRHKGRTEEGEVSPHAFELLKGRVRTLEGQMDAAFEMLRSYKGVHERLERLEKKGGE